MIVMIAKDDVRIVLEWRFGPDWPLRRIRSARHMRIINASNPLLKNKPSAKILLRDLEVALLTSTAVGMEKE